MKISVFGFISQEHRKITITQSELEKIALKIAGKRLYVSFSRSIFGILIAVIQIIKLGRFFN